MGVFWVFEGELGVTPAKNPAAPPIHAAETRSGIKDLKSAGGGETGSGSERKPAAVEVEFKLPERFQSL